MVPLCGVLLLIVHRTGLTRLLVQSGDGYQTLVQVLPATVIGLFAFAICSISVAAPLVAPARGSRSLLLLECRGALTCWPRPPAEWPASPERAWTVSFPRGRGSAAYRIDQPDDLVFIATFGVTA